MRRLSRQRTSWHPPWLCVSRLCRAPIDCDAVSCVFGRGCTFIECAEQYSLCTTWSLTMCSSWTLQNSFTEAASAAINGSYSLCTLRNVVTKEDCITMRPTQPSASTSQPAFRACKVRRAHFASEGLKPSPLNLPTPALAPLIPVSVIAITGLPVGPPFPALPAASMAIACRFGANF